MKTVLLAALLFAVSPALAYPQADKNFGKADDYGSDRFNAVNHCMVEAITNKQKPDPSGLSLTICMDHQGFQPCEDCQVFGNRGPKCAENRNGGFFHSWCWKEVE